MGRFPLSTWMMLCIGAAAVAGPVSAGAPRRSDPASAPHGTAAAPDHAITAADAAPSGPVAPGRLIVRYRATVGPCVDCLLASGGSFSSATGSDSLDRLNAELGVRSIRPLRSVRSAGSAGAFGTSSDGWAESIRARFPARAARASPGARVPDLANVYVVEFSEEIDVLEAAARYAADPAVVYAEPDRAYRAALLPDDPYLSSAGSWGQSYEDLWGLHAIGAPGAWDVSGGAGTVIAIVDTGVDPTHPDLAGNLWHNPGEIPGNQVDDDGNGFVDDVAGWDFDEDDADPYDRNGHGTHVAGTAAAVGDNALGIAGVAYRAQIMPVQGLGADGWGWTSDLIDGMLYAAENGADVINNSWGGFSVPSQALFDAVAAADALGVVVVSAAGNDGRPLERNFPAYLPAGHPDGLTVGALTPDGDLAGFSNYGPLLSLVAPGVDILSLRSAHHVYGRGAEVGDAYLRLGGTSMASPHAAGAAAVLLAAQPTLTTAEVRWHLELDADQPGSPGYEGELHNPVFGFGILDAARMFDVPPVTTRLDPPGIADWHGFPAVAPVPGLPASFQFTTIDPVAWTLSTPSWLSSPAAAGTGPGTLDLEITADGVAPGSYAGDVALLAPGTGDGGASFSTRVHVHEDRRVGGRIQVGDSGRGVFLGYSPESAANGVATLVTWKGTDTEEGQQIAVLDGAGNVTGPIAVTEMSRDGHPYGSAVATDGHDFLVLWEFDNPFTHPDEEGIAFTRVRPNGELIDAVPVSLFSRKERWCKSTSLAGAGYDGTDYWVAFLDQKWCGRDSGKVYLTRVHRDGSFGKRKRVLKLGDVDGKFACHTGGCLLVWMDWAVESMDENGKYIRSAWAVPLAGETSLSEPRKVATDLFGLNALANQGDQYMALSRRHHVCNPGEGTCRSEVIAFRMTSAGVPLDPNGIVVSNVPPGDLVYPWPGGLDFDGTDWVASYQIPAVDDTGFDDGGYVFANRIDVDGTPLADEYVGMLVDDGGRAGYSRVAATATHTVIVYEDGRTDSFEGINGHPEMTDHTAQRMFPHEPGPEYPDREIGAIGPLSVEEGGILRFRVAAPGLEAGTFSATGLPEGAIFDPATRLFQWRPTGVQAGSHPGAVFTAMSGATIVTEQVDLTVVEAIPSISGLVRLADSTPLAGAALRVKIRGDPPRTVYTDTAGRYRVEGVVPGKPTRIRLGKPARKAYRTEPRSIRITAAAGDTVAPDLVATPK